ncbi:hypothetical protein HDV00_003708 [Rhizophlyctis rosea]|nr:hypothetical protein HDV00_003708 [Rhizophlyctis rosea]
MTLDFDPEYLKPYASNPSKHKNFRCDGEVTITQSTHPTSSQVVDDDLLARAGIGLSELPLNRRLRRLAEKIWNHIQRYIRKEHCGSNDLQRIGRCTPRGGQTNIFYVDKGLHMVANDGTTLVRVRRNFTSPIVALQHGALFHPAAGRAQPASFASTILQHVYIDYKLFAWPCGCWKDNQPFPIITSFERDPDNKARLELLYQEPAVLGMFRKLENTFRQDYPKLFQIYDITFDITFLFLFWKAAKEAPEDLEYSSSINGCRGHFCFKHRDWRDVRNCLCWIYIWSTGFLPGTLGRSIFKVPGLDTEIPMQAGDLICLRSWELFHSIQDCEIGRGCSVFFDHQDQIEWVVHQLGAKWLSDVFNMLGAHPQFQELRKNNNFSHINTQLEVVRKWLFEQGYHEYT